MTQPDPTHLTDWFHLSIKPAHEGWYKVKFFGWCGFALWGIDPQELDEWQKLCESARKTRASGAPSPRWLRCARVLDPARSEGCSMRYLWWRGLIGLSTDGVAP